VEKDQVNSVGREVIAYCKLHNFVVKQKCVFFISIDLSHYSVHKNIKEQLKNNSLSDILCFMSKCTRIKCKISYELHDFLKI